MLTFFRRFRQKLVNSGSVTKYILYALGEVLLVVIGILIALQINNWNENRKLLAEEESILRSLRTDLQSGYKTGASYLSNDSTQFSILQTYLLDPEWATKLDHTPDMDSLITNTLFNLESQVPVIQVREDLNNSGKSTLISSQAIRNKLIELDSNTKILTFQIDDKLNVQQNRIDEVLIKHFDLKRMVMMRSGEWEVSEPSVDLIALSNDLEIANVLSLKLAISTYVLSSRQDLQNTIRELIGMIDEELIRF